ncbi:BNR repeat-containing protein [Carboxylicivirga caseinilyticus]|uniref:BNR repeat-containing protein n=1 Tax=Carboxylicivirga caseinilyticus TaxID=3417572 RepID=UPI003D33FFC1|nr:BNR repeat-containing protein [Marinilabiliaceae bacterium A049]
MIRSLNLIVVLFFTSLNLSAQNVIDVADGWSSNSVNAVVFRQNSLVTANDTQFIAFYNPDGYLTLGKRHIKSTTFKTYVTQYKGNVKDAHNCISIMVDGDGYLHVSWDHHGHPLRYARSIAPYGLKLGEKQSMAGANEDNVTYPQFFKMPDGNLIFMYRDGMSGRGNLAMQKYDTKAQKWSVLHTNLIDGEGQRNAYWQACIDSKGTIHLSWVWRETWDVSSNHDLCYARSKDGGVSWEKTNGDKYVLPVNAKSAEYACRIPQRSELINQTSIVADDKGQPYIASYWREQDSDVPQYQLVTFLNGEWFHQNLRFRSSAFSLSGGGTKRIPISRPQIVAQSKGKKTIACIIFRDQERDEKVSLAKVTLGKKTKIELSDITDFGVGLWEPSFDTELWKEKGQLHLFVQKVDQVDGEGVASSKPTLVKVIEVK